MSRKTLLLLSSFFAGVVPISATLVPQNVRFTSTFTDESHLSDANTIRAVGNEVNYTRNGSWIRFQNLNIGAAATHVYVEAANGSTTGRKIQVRTGSPTGTLLGEATVPNTGGGNNFLPLEIPLSSTLSGTQDLYFNFVGGTGNLFDTRGFWFPPVSPNLKQLGSVVSATGFDSESAPDTAPIVINNGGVESIENASWIAFTGFNFGTGANRIDIEASAPTRGGRIEVRLDGENGPIIGNVDINHTGSWTHHRIFSATLNQNVIGTRDFYLRFLDSNGGGASLFRLTKLSVYQQSLTPAPTQEGRLSIYPNVPTREGVTLDPSPYYTFSIQKASQLNASAKQNATNWLSPFAWFTKCVDYPSNQEQHSAYYDEYIGAWSHTYCNFELDANTPIVVKISRLNKPGAPSGPISSAVVRPAHRVISCEVIGGDVYVTMSEPALVAVDIDGQMENRDTPRTLPTGFFGDTTFPHRYENSGCHSLSIFANPFIDDKPSLTDPNVFAVEPGTLPPTSGSWTTLYFKPGIHKLSANPDGSERTWTATDPLFLENGKNYYIPGDAIVYGNMSDWQDQLASSNIRVFGHGTLCGTKIPHFRDFPPGTTPANEIPPVGDPARESYMTDDGAFKRPGTPGRLQIMSLSKAQNCRFEGVTVADPPEHGFRMIGGEERQNSLRWIKNISWRVNNDAASVSGNAMVEDCFFRHQDDGLYMSGQQVRRVVFWSDVNGKPLRCDFIHRERDSTYPSYFPPDEVIEDCDIIYARGVFFGDASDETGVIATKVTSSSALSPLPGNDLFVDGTFNTAQHLIFRNIRITDPKPQRYLLGFVGDSVSVDGFKGWAGIRMENIQMTHANTWTTRNPPSPRPNRIMGVPHGPARYWNFSNVTIAGQTMDQTMLDNPVIFATSDVSDMIFRNTTFALTRPQSTSGSVTTGTIAATPHATTYAANTPVQIVAVPSAGYVFSSWGGALGGTTSNPAEIVMDSDKTVSANFVPAGPVPTGETILFVVNDANAINVADTAIRDRLQALGHTVSVITALSSASGDANGKDLVIISSTVTSGQIGTKFRDVTVPVINWETALQDEFLFTTGPNQGTATAQSTLNLVNAGHPLAAGLPSGIRSVMSGTATSGFSWGQPGGSPIIIARLNAAAPNDQPCIYAYEMGAAMLTGNAPARRVHLFLQNDTFTNLNNDGKTLFDAAVSWAIATPTIPVTANLWTGATNSNWDDATNWSPSAVPVNGSTLTFNGTPANQPTNNALSGLTTGAILFTNTAPISTTPLVSGFTLGAVDLSQSVILGGNITTTAPTAGEPTDTIHLNLILNADRTITTTRNPTAALNHNLIIHGVISGGFQLTKGNSGGDLTLANPANSFSGPMNITGGTLIAGFLDVSGNNSSIGLGSVINLANAQLNFTGAVAPSGPINRSINLTDSGNGGGGIFNNGSTPLTFNGTFSNLNSSGNKTFTLGGSNTGANVFESALVNSPGGQILSFTKEDAGRWTLAGSNTYSGATTILNGTLMITGASQATNAITSSGGGVLGLDIASPVTAANATVTFTDRSVLVTGSPTSPSYTLLTASSIIGTPTLAAPTPPGYTLQVFGNELRLVTTDLYFAWAGSGVNFEDDANNDGIKNGLAWLLGAASPTSTVNRPLATENSNSLVLTFSILNAASRGSASAKVEHSSDLGNSDLWTAVTVPETTNAIPNNGVTFVVTPAGQFNTIVATISNTESAGGKLFGRLKGQK